MPDDEPTRENLIEARERLERQIAIMRSPAWPRDQNPQLVDRLEALLAEINDALANWGSDQA
jgi:hypothetical protein